MGITLPSFFIADHPAMIELMCALRTNVADYPAINDIFWKNADHPAITDILWPNADNPAIIWCIVSPHLYANIAVGKNPAHVVDKVWNCPAILDMLWMKCGLPCHHWYVVTKMQIAQPALTCCERMRINLPSLLCCERMLVTLPSWMSF